MATRKVQSTQNYALFTLSNENRELQIEKHKKLLESMRRYGFLQCFPIICYRNVNGQLVVKDGQHRLAIAEKLNLPVFWIEEVANFDVALVNCASMGWTLADYAHKFAANGIQDYQEGIDFAAQYKIPIGLAFSLLNGTTTFSNTRDQFVSGDFRIVDRSWAENVASIYTQLIQMAPETKSARLVEACMSACRVPYFNPDRLISCAARCRDKLVPYSTRDAYLSMLEEIYNYGQKRMVSLKLDALAAMRKRDPVRGKIRRGNAQTAEVYQ